MATREEAEVRAWKMGLLLTGDREGAERIVAAVLRGHPDLARRAEQQIARIVVGRAREWNAGLSSGRVTPRRDEGERVWRASGEGAGALWSASGELTPELREAWRVRAVGPGGDGVEAIVASRMLGLTREVVETRRERAEEVLRGVLGDRYEGALAALRGEFGALDPGGWLDGPRAVRDAALRRSKWWTVVKLGALLLAMGLLVFVVFDLLEWEDEQTELERMGERYSLPIEPDGEVEEGSP